jgi:acetyl-CoA acetyltransferase family protein
MHNPPYEEQTMRYSRAAIPLGFAWSSPFARWQGPLAEVSSLDLAVDVTRRALERRSFAPADLTQVVLGWTVPQPGIFYGAPTVAARLGAEDITGPMISQACATSVACFHAAASGLETDGESVALIVTTDRTSNGPHLVYPAPSGPGGQPQSEDWVMENFRRDPWAGKAMVETAERVATDAGISRAEIDEVTLLRYEQYAAGLADDRYFQRSYMVEAHVPSRRDPRIIEGDAGIHHTTAEGLANLDPVVAGGVITYGSQTHPADGTAGAIVTTPERAAELSGEGIVRILSGAFARVGKAEMPKAPVPAARRALQDAGLGIGDVDAVATHNPFTVNDIYFAREMVFPIDKMNLFGSSLVFGHPQGPTGARLIAELIETLRRRGGGIGLFTGCAAGDTGAALVIRVEG